MDRLLLESSNNIYHEPNFFKQDLVGVVVVVVVTVGVGFGIGVGVGISAVVFDAVVVVVRQSTLHIYLRMKTGNSAPFSNLLNHVDNNF